MQAGGSRLQKYLFSYEDKLQINIHYSLLSPTFLAIWRILVFLILSLRFLLVFTATYKSIFVGLQYLSYIGFTITWLYFALTCWDMLIFNQSQRIFSRYLQDWINLLFQIGWCLQYPITLVFWLILFVPTIHLNQKQLLYQIGIHGFPLFSLLIDFIFNSCQYPLRHLMFVLLFGLSYMAFNMVYSLTVKPIYKPINWTSLSSYFIALASLALAIAVHRFGACIWSKYKKQNTQEVLNKQMMEDLQ